ncbi:MAG: alpha-amylase [Segetibacter sp.]|nr:alpha-amylase [Segetibacter sp.]
MIKSFLVIVAFVSSFSVFGQAPSVYPTNWWVGMKEPKLQLMLHANGIAKGVTDVSINYPGVKVQKVHKVENENYLFVDVTISGTAKAGNVKINLKRSGAPIIVDFPLKNRRPGKGTKFAQGVTSADFVYLLMPDRFSNGDPTNDRVSGMRDQTLNRDSIYHRHGGDLQGVINHLDYLQNLGVTTVWLTPVLENDMPNRTEHGYAFTNHYKIEPRFGGETAYKKLSDALHAKGMKLIQDAVYNHVGSYHFTVLDKPMKDWLHVWPKFTQTSYKDQPLIDPYASKSDRRITSNGWFTTQMPDLNHSNPYVANYLIQHAIWSVEEFGVDGWRIDTYIYNDLAFMNHCNKALLDEYPSITMFGETWVHGTPSQAYFTENKFDIPFKSNLKGVTDFQTNLYGIVPAMNQNFGWTEGVNKLYQTLSQDFVYTNPMNHVIFLDNHDMSRFLSQVNDDVEKHKTGIAWLLTCRGIPQLYYGTEISMKGVSNPDGWVRLDFKGGWQEDKMSKFTKEGRTEQENEVHDWTMKLANFRKSSSAIKTGKMMQYAPDNGLYVYFRYDNNQTVMCMMNTSDKERDIDFTQFAERTEGFKQARNVVTGARFGTNKKLTIPAKRMWVIELSK